MFENHPKCHIRTIRIWHFPPIFVQLKLTCLVTLFDRKLQVFKNSPKLTIFGIFNELLSTQNVNVARYARNVECDFFYDFQTLWNVIKCLLTCIIECVSWHGNFFFSLVHERNDIWSGCKNLDFDPVVCEDADDHYDKGGQNDEKNAGERFHSSNWTTTTEKEMLSWRQFSRDWLAT